MKSRFLVPLLIAVACTGACHNVGSGGDASNTITIDFDDMPTGSLPAGWRVDQTNPEGKAATWAVSQVESAPSGKNTLALTRTNHGGQDTFNLCWTPEPRFAEGALEIRLHADAGEVDQGGGLAWRIQNANNYYICRMNPLESNLRVYFVKDGKRVQLATAQVSHRAGEWHLLRIEHSGTHIVCWLDGEKLLEAEDASLPEQGGIGCWTKADARTSFDDLKITARAP